MPDPDTILEDLQRAASTKRHPTDPLPTWQLEAMARGRAKAKAERQRAARERAYARLAERKAYLSRRGRIVDRVMALMEPGSWYGLKGLARAAGMGPSEAGRAKLDLLSHAWAARAANPRWDPRPVSPHEIQAGAIREPQWLYRLTVEGLAEKERVRGYVDALAELCGPASSENGQDVG